MNKEAVAATDLGRSHRSNNSTGERKIPPPIPTIPERSPIPPPTNIVTPLLIGLGGPFGDLKILPLLENKSSPDPNKTTPNKTKNNCSPIGDKIFSRFFAVSPRHQTDKNRKNFFFVIMKMKPKKFKISAMFVEI